MSRKNRPLLSLRGEVNVPTTEPIAQPPAEPNALIQETTMEASQGAPAQASEAMKAEAVQEQTGPTAKEMAAAEEANAARAKAIIDRQQTQLADQAEKDTRPTLIGLAAQGMDALHDAIRAASEAPKAEYIPPPRTERQMTQLEAELEAGRRSQQKAQAQLDARPVPAKDVSEGFTTPVYRPNDMVPDPTVPAAGGSIAGTRQFGADAP